MTRRTIGRGGALAAAVSAALLVSALAPTTAVAATPTMSCTSARAGLADKLKKDITAALAGRKSTVAVGLYDRGTKTSCTLRAAHSYDSASTVKVTVLAALLWDAKKQNRYLTGTEQSLATAMITKSDNAATSKLWKQLGTTKIKGFLSAADMTRTVPGSGGYWGLTRVNVRDEQRLLSLITTGNSVLSDSARAYIRKLMGQVVSSQRWGTPAGAPSSVSVGVKNGWVQRSTHGWRVHSLGTFQGAGHDYAITVLTHDNSTMNYGVTTIQNVSQAIHKALVPTGPGTTRFTPTSRPSEALVPVPPQG